MIQRYKFFLVFLGTVIAFFLFAFSYRWFSSSDKCIEPYGVIEILWERKVVDCQVLVYLKNGTKKSEIENKILPYWYTLINFNASLGTALILASKKWEIELINMYETLQKLNTFESVSYNSVSELF